MSNSPVSSILKKLAWSTGILLALVLAVHVLLPFAVNTSALRLRIISQAADRVGGEVDFKELTPVLLPLPHAIVSQGRIDRPGMFRIRFAKGVVYPRLWQLLTGRLKIGRLKLFEPDIVIPVSTDGLLNRQGTGGRSLEEIDQRIRQALTNAAGILHPLGFRIEGGRLTLTRASHTDMVFRDLHARVRVGETGLALSVSGRSNVVETFKLSGRMAFDSLDGKGSVHFTGVDAARLVSLGLMPPEVPMAVVRGDLALGFETRGLRSFHCQYKVQAPLLAIFRGSRRLTVLDLMVSGEGQKTPDGLRLSSVQVQTTTPEVRLSATASWPATSRLSWMPAEVTLKALDQDVTPVRTAALKLAGDQRTVRRLFDIIHAGRIPELDVRISGIGVEASTSGVEVDLKGRLSQGRIVLPRDLMHLEQVGGRVSLHKGRLTAENASARLGDSFARGGTLALGLFDGTRDFSLDAAIDADLSEVPAVLRKVAGSRPVVQLLDRLPPVTGRASGRLKMGERLDDITVNVSATGRMDTLDASMSISGNIEARPRSSPDCNLSFKGTLGPRMAAWLYDQWGISRDLMVRTPLTVSSARIVRNREKGLDVESRFVVSDGLKVDAALQVGPQEDFFTRAHLQDSFSDAGIEYRRTQAGAWQAGFTGKLEKSTADRLLRHNALILGWLRGDFRVRFQDGAPQRNSAQGRLEFRDLDMPPGFPIPMRLLSGKVTGNGSGFDLSSVALRWEDSTARLSGTGKFSPQSVRLDLDLDADNLDADYLARRVNPATMTPVSRSSGNNAALPIRGRVQVHARQMTLKGYRVAPLQAVVTLGDNHVSVDMIDAELCGIAIPGQIRFDPHGVKLFLKPHAAGAKLRNTDQCIPGTSVTERLEGTVSVHGDIESRGQSGEELVRNLMGKLDVQIADGRVYNVGAAGFFTNLLAFISVNQLIDGVMPDLRRDDFQYKSMTSRLSFQQGRMRIEEGVLKSNAVNIVASGDYGLADKELNLILLISPLTTVDWIIERIPLLGNILQGTLVAIPVGVKGPAVDPRVTPLSPTAVGSRLGGILERTLKTPYRILSPLLKDKPPADQRK